MRDRVMSHLAEVGELRDANGMASTMLAKAVGYPGSSIAFAQLLSGMERSGLIKREIRGKRTYVIAPAEAAPAEPAAPAVTPRRTAAGLRRSARPGRVAAARQAGHGRLLTDEGSQDSAVAKDPAAAAKAAEDFDYDELARRLLVQVVRRLTASPAAGPAARAGQAEAATAGDRPPEGTVASLEQKLVSARTRQRKLTAENAKLREQLREAERSLALARERASRPEVTEQLGSLEAALLERLLSSAREEHGRHEEAGAG